MRDALLAKATEEACTGDGREPRRQPSRYGIHKQPSTIYGMAMMAAKVRKHPREKVDIIELRRQLRALPLPPQPTRGRPYPTHTILGRIMRLKGIKVNDTIAYPGGPSYRLMADYLAGRKRVTPDHRRALAAGMGIDPRLLEE